MLDYAKDLFLIWSHPISGKWHYHGGWSFAFPPTFPSSAHPAIWRACDAPSVIIFQDKAGNYGRASIQPMLENYDLLQDRITSMGRHLVLENQNRRHRLLITPPYSGGSGYFIPHDPWFRTRLAAAEAFDFSMRPTGFAKSHATLFPTAYQKYRLTLLLRILDAIHRPVQDFATTREIAQNVLYRDTDLGRAVEWKSSSQRRQTQRLVNEARYFVHGGYRLLLKGSIQKKRANQ